MKMDLHRDQMFIPPKVRLDRQAYEEIGDACTASILRNIQEQRQADGSPLKQNAQGTQERKLREGKPLLSLVDEEHRFVKGRGDSWAVRASDDEVVVEPATEEFAEIVGYVQERGYVGWFGPSAEGWSVIRGIIRKALERILRSVTGG